MSEGRYLPRWWGDTDHMEALVRARARTTSDEAALESVGASKWGKGGLGNVLAWGGGRWDGPPEARPHERDVASLFARVWREARARGPKPRRPTRYKPMHGRTASTVRSRLSAILAEWQEEEQR